MLSFRFTHFPVNNCSCCGLSPRTLFATSNAAPPRIPPQCWEVDRGSHPVANETSATTTTTADTMTSDHLLSHLVRREPGVRVERTDPDFDHLAWFTIRKLLGNHYVIGDDGQAVTWFRSLMKRMPLSLNAYVSPWSVVTAAEPDHEFLTTAKSEQRAWYARLQSMLFGSARTQKYFGIRGSEKAKKDPALRQLEYHGILIVSGRHIFPNQWPDPVEQKDQSKQQERLTLVGLTFGKLTVIADLPQQRHRCQCICGNVTVADRNHLRSGRKKSCGCLAEAQRKIFAARRHRRGR